MNIICNNNYIDLYFAENTSEPIPEYWYKFCEFTFDKTCYMYGHIEIKEYEWYYIMLLTNNMNIIDNIEIINLLKLIRKS